MRLGTEEYAYSVEFMCGRLGVSRSGYYDWRSRPESATAQRRKELKLLIGKAFRMSNGTYGHRRVQAQLDRWGITADLELVRRLMHELGFEACQPRPKRFSLTQAAAGQVPELVGRDFTADTPGENLVGDIAYIATGEGWLYLATVIDCCTKEVIGYAMDNHYQTPLISRAIRNAARNWNHSAGAMFHTVRGSNYMSAEFGKTLDRFRLRRSSGRTGICFDNAMAESFFGVLKNERVSRGTYLTREAAQQDITRYIEFWYKSQIHRNTARWALRTPGQRCRPWRVSRFRAGLKLSVAALSALVPTAPREQITRSLRHALAKSFEAYWAPLPLWKTAPARSPPRVRAAASRASVTSSVRM